MRRDLTRRDAIRAALAACLAATAAPALANGRRAADPPLPTPPDLDAFLALVSANIRHKVWYYGVGRDLEFLRVTGHCPLLRREIVLRASFAWRGEGVSVFVPCDPGLIESDRFAEIAADNAVMVAVLSAVGHEEMIRRVVAANRGGAPLATE